MACMADIYAFEQDPKNNTSMSLKDFRNIICEKLTLDVYIQLQNGSLVSQFISNKKEKKEIQINEYKNQKLYENIDKREESQMSFFKHCIRSFETFIEYIRNPESKIDHVFMWDIMTRTILFKNGLNIAIFELMDNDITNKVKLVCPTEQYKSPLFDLKRPTVFLLKNNDLYEPIYQVQKVGQDTIYDKYFYLKHKGIGDMDTILKTIQETTESQCKPYMKKKNIYKFKENFPSSVLYEKMRQMKFKVSTRIVNYQNKIIGLGVEYKKRDMYLPCFPSTSVEVDELTQLKWMEDDTLWHDYEKTVGFLNHVYSMSDNKIPCKPAFRVVEDGMIVGILTQTNQFVQIDPPVQNVKNDLPEMKASNYIMADKAIMNYDEEPEKTNRNVQYVHLENQFYNAFRTTIRIVMQMYKNRKIVDKLHTLYHRDSVTHLEKIKRTKDYLKRMGNDHISFQQYDDEVLMSLYQVYSCKMNAKNKSYCVVQQGKTDVEGILVVPNKHLLTKEDNEEIYYTRMADELLRHRRVHLFMFYPEQYLNIQDQEYQINEDEFITIKGKIVTV